MPATGTNLFQDWQPTLTKAGVILLILCLPMAIAWTVDGREIAEASVWAKPMRFATSLGIYLLSLGFFWQFLTLEKRTTRLMRMIAVSVVATVFVEQAYIALQAARGAGSHFNFSTVWTSLGYALMGVCATWFTAMSVVLGWQIHRNPRAGLSPAIRTGIVLGLILTAPLTFITAGYLSAAGGHFVGPGSEAAGLPIFGWSLTVGDLRVPHFFATHALQVIPIAAVLFGAVLGWQRRWPVIAFSVAYVIFVGALFAQALAGQPFLGFLA